MGTFEELRIQKTLKDRGTSRARKYTDLFVGRSGVWELFKYELVMFCSWVPGAIGLLARNAVFPLVLGKVGKSVGFGRNVALRHPHRIRIGDNVVIEWQHMSSPNRSSL